MGFRDVDDRNLGDDHHGALDDHRMNVTDDRNDLNLDVSRVNRSCAPHDPKMVANLIKDWMGLNEEARK